MWSEGEPALSMFIWHAPGSVMMIEDGHRSDMEQSQSSSLFGSFFYQGLQAGGKQKVLVEFLLM